MYIKVFLCFNEKVGLCFAEEEAEMLEYFLGQTSGNDVEEFCGMRRGCRYISDLNTFLDKLYDELKKNSTAIYLNSKEAEMLAYFLGEISDNDVEEICGMRRGQKYLDKLNSFIYNLYDALSD